MSNHWYMLELIRIILKLIFDNLTNYVNCCIIEYIGIVLILYRFTSYYQFYCWPHRRNNFWEIGEGPSGPDSEIFYDRGPKYDPDKQGIKLLESLNHKAQIIRAESNDNFDLALENSKLLEDKLVRNMRIKLIEYMRK